MACAVAADLPACIAGQAVLSHHWVLLQEENLDLTPEHFMSRSSLASGDLQKAIHALSFTEELTAAMEICCCLLYTSQS